MYNPDEPDMILHTIRGWVVHVLPPMGGFESLHGFSIRTYYYNNFTISQWVIKSYVFQGKLTIPQTIGGIGISYEYIIVYFDTFKHT